MHPSEAYQMVVEQIVETDEDLMNRYLEGETIAADELARGRLHGDRRGQARPGRLPLGPQGHRRQGAARPDRRLRPEPRPTSTASARGDRGATRSSSSRPRTATLVAQVFKTTNDLFMGKLSFLRILSGPDRATTRRSSTCGPARPAKPGHLYRLQGKTQEEVKEAIAGDIVAIAKFDDLHISDTVTTAAATASRRT